MWSTCTVRGWHFPRFTIFLCFEFAQNVTEGCTETSFFFVSPTRAAIVPTRSITVLLLLYIVARVRMHHFQALLAFSVADDPPPLLLPLAPRSITTLSTTPIGTTSSHVSRWRIQSTTPCVASIWYDMRCYDMIRCTADRQIRRTTMVFIFSKHLLYLYCWCWRCWCWWYYHNKARGATVCSGGSCRTLFCCVSFSTCRIALVRVFVRVFGLLSRSQTPVIFLGVEWMAVESLHP